METGEIPSVFSRIGIAPVIIHSVVLQEHALNLIRDTFHYQFDLGRRSRNIIISRDNSCSSFRPLGA